jgi:hypothetical protein
MRVRRAATVALVFATVAGLPGVASASWGGRGSLASSGAWLPTVAANSHGDVVSAWYQEKGGSTDIVARVSRDGGRHWGATQDLGPAVTAPGTSRPIIVRAAVDNDGDAVVVWEQALSDHLTVVVSSARRGQAFGAAQAVSAAGVDAFYPDAVADGHRFAVVWVTQSTVEDALVSGAGTITAHGTVASGQSMPDSPTVTGDGGSRLAFAWTEQPGATIWINVARQAIGGTPAVATVSKNGVDNPIGLALSRTGRTTVVWTEMQGNAGAEVIDARTAVWGHRFGGRQQLSASGQLAIPGGGGGGSRGVGIDKAGRVSAIWVEGIAGSYKGGGRVRVATSNASGHFAPTRTLQSAKDPLAYERPAIAVSANGTVIATWTRYDMWSANPSGVVWASEGRATGAFSHPVAVSATGGDASAVTAVGAKGNAVAVWEVGDGTTNRVQFRRWTPD